MQKSVKVEPSRLNPQFTIDRVKVVLHPLELASVPTDKLGEFVCSLNQQGSAITDAIDEVLMRSWG
jgi:toxin CcdB